MTPSAFTLDRLHPLLVRDVRRAFRTRTYGLTATASCLATVAIALLAVDRQAAGLEIGSWLAATTLRALCPVLLLAVPMQAFQTLREETDGQTADQLVLAGLRPGAIVLGILATALLQTVVFLGFFAPLLGFAYQLSGIDLPTLLRVLVLAPLLSLSCASLALATIALRRISWIAPYLTTLAMAILGAATWFAIEDTGALLAELRRQSIGWNAQLLMSVGRQVLVGGLGITFFGLVAAGALTPLPEARSVAFRRLGVAAAPTFTLLGGGGMAGAIQALGAVAPFWFLAVTTPLALTRRQVPLVPRGTRAERIRLAPFLPGSGRGLVYAAVLTATCLIAGLVTELALFGRLPDRATSLRALGLAALGMAYAGYSCHYRVHVTEPGRGATSIARLALVRRFVLLWLLSGILDSWTIGVRGELRAFLSMANPWIHVAGPSLLPAPGVVFGTALFAALLLLLPTRIAVKWSFAELEAPGHTHLPPELSRRGSKRRRRSKRGSTNDRHSTRSVRRESQSS